MRTQEKVNAGIRLGSMVLDHFIMCAICMVFFIPMMVSTISDAIAVSHERNAFMNFSGPSFYIGLFGFALYFCKDSFNGRSLAKRITKLQVVDNTTGLAASPLQCFIRNTFCIIWPLEVLLVLVENPARRIGDRVAGTKVVYYDPAAEKPHVNFAKFILPLVLSFGLMLSLAYLLNSAQPSIPTVNYVKSSYNEEESKALEKLYSDSLGQYLTASVKVYDTISNSKLKYISVIYNLKGNYLEDDILGFKQLTMKHLYSLFPENSFSGWAQYVFRDGGSFQSSSNAIGVRIVSSKE